MPNFRAVINKYTLEMHIEDPGENLQLFQCEKIQSQL